ncbi:MAG: GFA family protein [Novosphingobium sp.]
MSEKRSGGCLCGAVRYEMPWPPKALVVCHCCDCQKQAGTAFSVVGVARRDDLVVSGDLQTFSHPGSSGQTVNRKFCGNCGSPILTDTAAARDQDIIFFKAGTLDQSADLKPTVHYWTRSAQHWFEVPAGVTCLEKQ